MILCKAEEKYKVNLHSNEKKRRNTNWCTWTRFFPLHSHARNLHLKLLISLPTGQTDHAPGQIAGSDNLPTNECWNSLRAPLTRELQAELKTRDAAVAALHLICASIHNFMTTKNEWKGRGCQLYECTRWLNQPLFEESAHDHPISMGYSNNNKEGSCE